MGFPIQLVSNQCPALAEFIFHVRSAEVLIPSGFPPIRLPTVARHLPSSRSIVRGTISPAPTDMSSPRKPPFGSLPVAQEGM